MSDKNKKILFVAGLLTGALLLILPNFIKPQKVEEEPELEYYNEVLEKKIETLISGVSGAGKAQVIVTLDRTTESLYAQNSKVDTKSSSSDYLVIEKEGEETGLRLAQIYPKVRGVAIVCEGGRNDSVRAEITALVAAALGISSARIMVSG